jgi:hypothetical protein
MTPACGRAIEEPCHSRGSRNLAAIADTAVVGG